MTAQLVHRVYTESGEGVAVFKVKSFQALINMDKQNYLPAFWENTPAAIISTMPVSASVSGGRLNQKVL